MAGCCLTPGSFEALSGGLAAGGFLRKIESRTCGCNRNIQSQCASLSGALLQHHLTDNRGARVNGAVLKDALCRLFLVACGPADLMNADSGRSAHRCSRQNPRGGIVDPDRTGAEILTTTDRAVAGDRGGLVRSGVTRPGRGYAAEHGECDLLSLRRASNLTHALLEGVHVPESKRY